MLKLGMQYFALNPRPNFDPDHVTMMDYKTGEIPKEESNQIITEVKYGSAYMKLAKAVAMTKPIKEFTHLSGVGAYWVNEAERIRTDRPTWLTVEMRAYKMGVIIPVTKETLYYSVTNFFELMRPEIAEAFAKKFDVAAFANIDNPYAQSILTSAQNVGHIITESSNKYDDINEAMGQIEAQDLDPNGIASTRGQKRKYRGTKDETGYPIFNAPTAGEPGTVLGLPIAYMPNQSYGEPEIAEIVADWNNAYYGILQGIEYKILDQATLTTISADDQGNPVNLAERDMFALRATMAIGMMVVKDEAFSVVIKDNGGGGASGDIPEA